MSNINTSIEKKPVKKTKKHCIKQNQSKKILNRRYILGEKIGEGGLSCVYDVKDIYAVYFEDNKSLVLKMPSSKLRNKKDISAFVYSEYSLLCSLQHKNIIRVFDFGIDDSSKVPFIVMAKLEGELLVNIPVHQIDKKMKNHIMLSLYEAISYLHKKGVVHADINPSNIMISSDGLVQVFDFGISQTLDSQKKFHLDLAKVNAYNFIYSAPEVIRANPTSKKTDVFSLACVLFELYTNTLPFKEAPSELFDQPITNKQLSKIPLFQRRWFKKALSFHPEKRPSTIPFYIRFQAYLKSCLELP